MSKDKLLLSFLLAGGAVCGAILALIFSSQKGDREFNSILDQCREKLGKVEELLKEV
ncbi:MAG: hypothetical protein QXT84_07475 [Candidatus Bathyarchaeia archaeon]